MDKLDNLFKMQAELNDKIFKKQGIMGYNGLQLTSDKLYAAARFGLSRTPNSMINIWLKNFLTALEDESRELREELLWKWWSSDTLNMQNIRVEIIDQLHFWISLAMTAGMSAEEVFDLYCQKNKVNHKRQEGGYSKANKDESDNEGIGK